MIRGRTRHRLVYRLSPFAAAAVLGLVLAPLHSDRFSGWFLSFAALLTVLAGATVLLVPWPRIARGWRLAPALLYLLSVGLLREASGGATGGAGVLVLVPVTWVALYDSRAHLRVVLLSAACVFAIPLLAVGAPDYPVSGWRPAALVLALATIIGFTVQRLVDRIRRQAADARAAERERSRLLKQVQLLAHTDSLTGVGNRRAWQQALDDTFAGAPSTLGICLLLIDLDGFKALNDSAGHHAGDRALQLCARAWAAQLRPTDLLARVGGDEFGVLLVDCNEVRAQAVLERLLAATPPGVSYSAGLACRDGDEDAERLQRRADAVLYRAKQDRAAYGDAHAVRRA